MLNEFKTFIMRGNIIDLAVGVIIGTAFSKIVDSIVEHLIMPIIGIVTGGIDFSKEAIKVGDASLGWGAVFQSLLQFMLIGLVLYLILKAYNTAAKNAQANLVPEPRTEDLLKDIKKSLENIDAKTR